MANPTNKSTKTTTKASTTKGATNTGAKKPAPGKKK